MLISGWAEAVCDFEALACMCGQGSEMFVDPNLSFARLMKGPPFREIRLLSATLLMHSFDGPNRSFSLTPRPGLFQTFMVDFVTRQPFPKGVSVSRRNHVTEFHRKFKLVYEGELSLDSLVNTVLYQDQEGPTLKGPTGIALDFQLDELDSGGLFDLFNILRGQTPELHRTVASALLEANDEMLEVVVRNLPFPTPAIEKTAGEILEPLLRDGRGTRSLLENAVLFVRLLDICGLLHRFVSALADETDDRRLRRCKQLLDRLQEKWVEEPVKRFREQGEGR